MRGQSRFSLLQLQWLRSGLIPLPKFKDFAWACFSVLVSVIVGPNYDGVLHCSEPVTEGISGTLGVFCLCEATANAIACAKQIGAVTDRDKGPGCS